MHEREVVITGTGLVTPLGKDTAENWENLISLKTGIAYYPKDGLPNSLQHMGRVTECSIPEDIPHKLMGQIKFLNRGALLGFLSVREAVTQAGINMQDISPGRRALYIASGDFTKVGHEFMYPAIKDATGGKWRDVDYEKLNNSALDKVNPFFLLESLHNNLFSFLSAFLEFMGPNASLASLSPCGGQALELAYRSIKQGKADIALAVGYCNWITDIPMYEIETLGILSGCSSGVRSFMPFDRRRDGFIPGEGGAAVFLEAEGTALKRGANILGRIKGTANYNEFSTGRGFTVPPKVSKRGMELALQSSGCEIADMSFIIPHGSGTQKGDRSELMSLMDILGTGNLDMPVCGLKPYTGHLGAASDIAEVIFGMNGIKNGLAPATLNFGETEKEFSGLNISGSHQGCGKDHFMSVSYGIGGQSSTVVVEAK